MQVSTQSRDVKDGKQVYTPLNKRPDGSPYE